MKNSNNLTGVLQWILLVKESGISDSLILMKGSGISDSLILMTFGSPFYEDILFVGISTSTK